MYTIKRYWPFDTDIEVAYQVWKDNMCVYSAWRDPSGFKGYKDALDDSYDDCCRWINKQNPAER